MCIYTYILTLKTIINFDNFKHWAKCMITDKWRGEHVLGVLDLWTTMKLVKVTMLTFLLYVYCDI